MACLTNYTIQCRDVASGETGCFLFDLDHWQATGEFLAVSPVYPNLAAFYAGTTHEQRRSVYLERLPSAAQ